MAIDITDWDAEIYTVRELADLAKVNRSVITDWIRHNIIQAPASPGHGYVRKLSFRNALQATMAAWLNNMGLRAGTVAYIMKSVSSLDLNNDILFPRIEREGLVIIVRLKFDGRLLSCRREGDEMNEEDRSPLELRIDFGRMARETAEDLKMGAHLDAMEKAGVGTRNRVKIGPGA